MSQDVEEIPSQDYVIVRFEKAVIPTAVVIYETYNPGAVVRIWGRHVGERWIKLWEGKPEICAETSRKFSPPIRKIADLINEVRLDLNHTLLNYQTALDAVLLAGKQPSSELQRLLFRKGLVNIPLAEAPKLDVEDVNEDDVSFVTLPYDVIVHIFQYLDLKTLGRCAQVCKLWHAATLDPRVYCHLSLKRYWNEIDDNIIWRFMERCRTLRKLDLSWCGCDNRLTEDTFVEFLSYSCKYLTHLSLCHSRFVTALTVSSISKYCRDLVELRLHDCHLSQSSSGFLPLSELNKLRTLDLYCSNIRDDELICILRKVPDLEHINIDLCSYLRRFDNIAETVAENNRNLITWSSWKIDRMTAGAVRNLSRCNRLRELDLGWCFIWSDPEDCLEYIAHGCKDLRRLILSRWRNLPDQCLRSVIRACKHLTQLDLLGTNVSGEVCEMILSSLPELRLLDLSFCNMIQSDLVQYLVEVYKHVTIHHSLDGDVDD